MAFDRKLAVRRYGDSAKALCAELGMDPDTNVTVNDQVFDCLVCIAPRWQHVAHRMLLSQLLSEASL